MSYLFDKMIEAENAIHREFLKYALLWYYRRYLWIIAIVNISLILGAIYSIINFIFFSNSFFWLKVFAIALITEELIGFTYRLVMQRLIKRYFFAPDKFEPIKKAYKLHLEEKRA